MKLRLHLLLLIALAALVSALAPPATAATETADTASDTTTSTAEETKDDKSAAERRAEGSEFEQEKLDQSAFDEDAKSSEDEASKSSSGGAIARMIFGLLVVVGAVFGVHWLLKRWGQSRLEGTGGKSGIIDVVATTPLAQGRALHLVRVGEELVLVGATEQSITRLGEVDAKLATDISGNRGDAQFQSMLQGAMYSKQPGVPEGMNGSATNQPFMRRFLDNLRMSTAR